MKEVRKDPFGLAMAGIAEALVALYLPGGPRSASTVRGRWPGLVRSLREAAPETTAETLEALRVSGFSDEALILSDGRLRAWAAEQHARSLTVVDDTYPRRWAERLGDAAPPAVWFRDHSSTALSWPVAAYRVSMAETRYIGVVGSRQVDADTSRFAAGVAAESVRLGFGVVSGGAVGCDASAKRAVAAAGGRLLTLLPYGLGRGVLGQGGSVVSRRGATFAECELSLSPWDADFSTAAAMERNLLIHAAAEATVVVHARFKAGGGWHGAVAALRRRVGRVFVRQDPASQAHRALVALGARPLAAPEDLGAALEAAARVGGYEPEATSRTASLFSIA